MITGMAQEGWESKLAVSVTQALRNFYFPCSNILRTMFPLKKEEQIQDLMEAVGWGPDSNTDMLNYRALFTEVGRDI